ncbi:MAG: OB-fold domain-containing protein [Firmicutes bacterium]|nr:OB-fold domain-containing protein [Bacillota bacterium]
MTDYQRIYWEKVDSGQLWLQFCPNCQKFVFYPRELCPFCLQAHLEWRPVSGTGKVHSYTIVYVSALPEFQDKVPYLYALVELDEGVKMSTNLIDCSLDQVQVDLPVIFTTMKREGKTLPVFRPI